MKVFIWILSVLFISTAAGVYALDQNTTAPDNSGINQRDQGPSAKNPETQSGDKSDVEVTRQIRREITKDDSLSISAHNVKIITENGKVTLRGPVNSREEKETVLQKAQQIAGAGNVQNELEVKSSVNR
jgi:hyperosmotically inducible periplasmic protein